MDTDSDDIRMSKNFSQVFFSQKFFSNSHLPIVELEINNIAPTWGILKNRAPWL